MKQVKDSHPHVCLRSFMRSISIGGGEPEYDTPSNIIDAMKKAMEDGYTHYGDFRHIPELRQAVAAKYKRYGVEVDPEQVIITPGSTMGIYMAYKALMKPGDEFIVTDPCFFGYFLAVKDQGIKPVPVPRSKEDWSFNIDDIYKATTEKTKAVLICSPDNPTGAVLSDKELKELAEYSIEKDVKIISDDIYDEILYDGAKFKSIASLPGMKERTIILNGLSKTYAMTGWRVGYIIPTDKETYDYLFSLQMSTYLVLNQALQYASLEALTGPQDSVKRMVEGYRKKRDYVIDTWNDMPKVSISKPKGAFYAFPDLSAYGMSSAKMAEYIKKETNVAITPGHLFGAQGEGHIRNSFAQSMDDLSEGLSRIKTALAKL
ncbi:pyridoxal phosphate-dependent aminotransferase [Candidatus Bathyarchaeota archaeon]|nr:pyridoxal phosphate-dependent aminotransferase [Candidatus Bathyarchaeota archaeon]